MKSTGTWPRFGIRASSYWLNLPLFAALTVGGVSLVTRVMTADPVARAKFRRYGRSSGQGNELIRWLMLVPLRNEAERRARYGGCYVESRPF